MADLQMPPPFCPKCGLHHAQPLPRRTWLDRLRRNRSTERGLT